MTNLYRIICFLLLLPLFYLNVRDSHDWGDDFAQYLMQARNIVEHKSQTDNGLVFDQHSGDYALHAYPVGFPVLLAPVYSLSGLSIRPYEIALSAMMFILGFLLFHYFKDETDPFIALLLVILFSYNTLTLEIKEEILSEIPFTLFLFILVLFLKRVFRNPSFLNFIFAGCLCGLVASIRAIGWIAIPALVAVILLSKDAVITALNSFSKLKLIAGATAGAVFIFLLLNLVLFRIPVADFFGFYSRAMQQHDSKLWSNLIYYKDISAYFFPVPLFNTTVSSAWLLLPIGLLLFRLKKNPGFEDWFILLYILVLTFYPYSSGGFRFVFPVFPFLLLYSAIALMKLIGMIPFSRLKLIVPFILLFLIAGYLKPLQDLANSRNSMIRGPQEDSSREMFAYLHEHASENDVSVYCKARALALYTRRLSAYLVEGQDPSETDSMFRRMGVRYLVYPKVQEGDELYDKKMIRYLESYEKSYSVAWENSAFRIYKRSS